MYNLPLCQSNLSKRPFVSVCTGMSSSLRNEDEDDDADDADDDYNHNNNNNITNKNK